MIASQSAPPASNWRAEQGKLGAFFRRDFLVAWSYRFGFITGLVGLVAQAVVFSFVSRMVDRSTVPQYGDAPTSYMAFVAVGIALSSLLNVGIGRMTVAVRSEQMMGTLESLLVTPTSPITLQLGWVLYDLVDLPLRIGAFLSLAAAFFDVNLQLHGIGPAIVIVAVFLPFVWGLAAASAAAVLTLRQTSGLVGLGGYALGVVSGAFFPLDLLPAWLAEIVRYNPVALALHGMRMALLGGAGWAETLPLLALLVPISAITLGMGLLAFRSAEARERRNGTLGIY